MLKGDTVQNAIIAKKMNGKIYVSCVQSVNLAGVPTAEKKQTYDFKLWASLKRSKKNVQELLLCNSWEWFGTITFDKSKVSNRYAIQETVKTLRTWLNNYKKRKAPNLKYCLIPELHKDGAVHLHGCFAGIPSEHLKAFEEYPEETIKLNDWEKLANLRYCNFLPLFDKFGRNSFGRINSHEGTAHYCSKYISKDMVSAVTETNLHTYYASQGLNKAERIGIYDSKSPDIAKLKWDWQGSYTDTETGEIIETCTYKKTFDNESAFQQWLLLNGIKKIKD